MAGAHTGPSGLFQPGRSPLHRAAPEVKIAATLVFVLAVVATPRQVIWAFGLHGVVVLALAGVARLPVRLVARRARIEVPFMAFALFLPLVGEAPKTNVGGVALSVSGLWGAWNIVAKGTLGVLAAVVLTATTPVSDLLAGLRRLRVPSVVVAIAGFMVRYVDVVAGEAARMRTARLSRADDPRWLWQARGFAATAGALFVRSYERGERVHVAMQARGYSGTMPDPRSTTSDTRAAILAAVPPVVALAVTVGAWVAT